MRVSLLPQLRVRDHLQRPRPPPENRNHQIPVHLVLIVAMKVAWARTLKREEVYAWLHTEMN